MRSKHCHTSFKKCLFQTAKFTTTILDPNIYFIALLLEQVIVNFLSGIKAQLYLIDSATKLSKMHPIIYLQGN